MLKTLEKHQCKFHCPIRHPSRDITRTRFLIHVNQVFSTKNGENGIFAIPRSILRLLIGNFNDVFEPHVHTNGKPGFFLFFYASYGRFHIFSDRNMKYRHI